MLGLVAVRDLCQCRKGRCKNLQLFMGSKTTSLTLEHERYGEWLYIPVVLSYFCDSTEMRDISCMEHGSSVRRPSIRCLPSVEDIYELRAGGLGIPRKKVVVKF